MRVRAIPSDPERARDAAPLGSVCRAGASLAGPAALLDLLVPALAALLQRPSLLHAGPAVVGALLSLGGVHLLMTWLLGGQACLRYPWWSRRQVLQRQLWVVLATLLAGLVVLSWLPLAGSLKAQLLARLPLLALLLALGGMLLRLGLQSLLRRRARGPSRDKARPLGSGPQPAAAGQGRSAGPSASPGRSDRWHRPAQGRWAGTALPTADPTADPAADPAPVTSQQSDSAAASSPCGSGADSPPQRQLLLLFVAYHPSAQEVEQLLSCLNGLPASIGYAVVVNDHRPGEAVERLAQAADAALFLGDNPGYGRAVNRLVAQLGSLPPYIGVLNTDLLWCSGSFETLLTWLQQHPDVSLAVPRILDPQGITQKLCKRHPTLLGLCSRRFLPERFKPAWLKRYDRWYVMADHDYDQVFAVPYLSGCCMLINSQAFGRAGGFDDQYFLYLEDADLSRCLALQGPCLHVPVASVEHGWGRGNYRSFKLMLVNLISAWLYFRKWGWALW